MRRREQYQEPRGTFQEHTREDALFIANEVREMRLYDVLLCLPLWYTTLITLASEGVSVQTTSKLRPLLNLS